jgi:membrane-bound metal-dependent hydrolase YbcI (DUF457 family)
MPVFGVHLVVGLIIGIFGSLFLIEKRDRIKLIIVATVSAVMPDVDVVLGGFDLIDIDTHEYLDPMKPIFNDSVRYSISDRLNEGIMNIDHRGITHSLELFLLLILTTIIVTGLTWVKEREKKQKYALFGLVIVIAWYSHLLLDFWYVV